MAEDLDKPTLSDNNFTLRRLINETGITNAQATELISLLGLNWSSLVREARILNQKR